jgi:hypothetical protein
LPPITGNTAWDRHRIALRGHFENDNPNRFLRWSTIQATMFVGEAPYIVDEYNELMDVNLVPYLWRAILKEPGIGKPQRLSYAEWTSGNLVHQAYHLKQWLDLSDHNIHDLDCIVEIGGGYGAMALICHRLGFDGTYCIVDLPEFSLLQNYYLDQCGITNVVWTSADVADEIEPDLVIALFSVSEMPLSERKIPKSDNYLFAYQPHWMGIDNMDYFWHNFALEQSVDIIKLGWKDYVNPHFGNYRYLVGV